MTTERRAVELAVVITHFASTPERDELLRLCLDGVDRMRRGGRLAVCLVSGTPIPVDLARRCEASLFLGGNPGHVTGEARLVRRGLELAGWLGASWVLKLASDCVLRDDDLPWRWRRELVTRGKGLVTCKWGHNRSLGTLSFVGRRELLVERFPDLEAEPREGNLEEVFFQSMRDRLDEVLLLHNYDLDFLRTLEGGGLHCHSLERTRRFLELGEVPAGTPALWFVPHEDRWEGVERSLCADVAVDPRHGRPPARPLGPLRARILSAQVSRGGVGIGGALGHGEGQVTVGRERFVNAISAHAPHEIELEVEVVEPAGQVVHLGLAFDDGAYRELRPGDHPMFRGLVATDGDRIVADLGWVGVTRNVAWRAIELPRGIHRLRLRASTERPELCHSVWLFENQLSVQGR